MREGRIKFFDPYRMFGIIVPNDGGKDVIFMGAMAKIAGLTSLKPGTPVRFKSTTRPSGDAATALYGAAPGISAVYQRLVDRAAVLHTYRDPDIKFDADLMSEAAAALIARAEAA